MKPINIILFFVMCLSAHAQTSMQGGSMQGGSMGGTPLPIQNNVYAWWRADQGVSLTGAGNTNVQAWNDVTVNAWPLTQYSSTNQAIFIPSYTTNNFPAVYFTGTPSSVMTCDAIAPAFSGANKPFSFIACFIGQSIANNVVAAGFGNNSAISANSSIIGLSLNRPGAGTTKGCFYATDTNLVALANTTFFKTSGAPTNRYSTIAAVFDGTNGMIYLNLSASTNQVSASVGNMTLNQFTVGASRGTNGTFGARWAGAFTELQIYTNALNGTQVTNVVNDMNARFPTF